jgi:hypothetical protein
MGAGVLARGVDHGEDTRGGSGSKVKIDAIRYGKCSFEAFCSSTQCVNECSNDNDSKV